MIPTDKVLSVDQGHPERSGQQCRLLERGWGGGLFFVWVLFSHTPHPGRGGLFIRGGFLEDASC